MENIGIVRNFRYFTPQAFGQLKEDLAISLDLASLQKLSGYYRKFKRDPFVDELYLLDQIAKELNETPMPLTFDNIYFAGKEVQTTYADFLAKKSLLGRAKNPVNTSFLLETANNYLLAHDGKLPTKALALLPFGTISTKEENLFAFPYEANKKKDNDHLLLVSLGENDEKISAVLEYLTDNKAEFVKICALDGSLFPTLIANYSGLICNLPCVNEGNFTLYRDFHSFVKKNSLLLRVNAEKVKKLMDEATTKELPIFDAFALQTNQNYKISYGEVSYELPFDVLVSLLKIGRVNAKEPTENGDVLFGCGCRENGRYLLQKDNKFSAVCQGERSICSFVSTAGYEDTYKALLTARETLLLTGGNVKELSLCAKIFVGKQIAENDCGYLVGVAMAFYRFEAEFGLFANVHACYGEENKVLVAMSAEKGEDTTAKVGKVQLDSSNIYYIPLPESLDKAKWADYDNMLAKLPIYSLSYSDGKNLEEDLEALESEDASVLPLEEDLRERALPKGFLVETNAECEFKKISETKKKENVAYSLLDLSESCIYAEIPTVLVVGEDEDKDAELLYKALCKEKLEVSFATVSDYGKLSRSLLTAQMLVLCGDVNIPKNNWTHYALSVFNGANGKIARVQGTKGGKGVTKYPIGLPIPFWKR